MLMAICKSWNGESGNEMRGMMGTQGIKVAMRKIRVEMREIRVGMLGMPRMRGISVKMRGIRVEMRRIRVGMRGIRVEMWVHKYLAGILQGFC